MRQARGFYPVIRVKVIWLDVKPIPLTRKAGLGRKPRDSFGRLVGAVDADQFSFAAAIVVLWPMMQHIDLSHIPTHFLSRSEGSGLRLPRKLWEETTFCPV